MKHIADAITHTLSIRRAGRYSMGALVMALAAVALVAVVVAGASPGSGQPAYAQDGGDACTDARVSAAIGDVQALMVEAQAHADAGDLASALALFEDAQTAMSAVQDGCVRMLAPALCEAYPQYCVPLAGGPAVVDDRPLETADVRDVDSPVADAAPGVVRGVTDDGALFIGDPDAPVVFTEMSDFACPHCVDYHESTITPLIADLVLSGQARFELRLLAFVAGEFSLNAAQAMLCAAEQGGAWEMHDALYASVRADGARAAYAPAALGDTANRLGLDGDALAQCVTSGRYISLMNSYRQFAVDNDVTGTPTMLINVRGEGWSKVENRSLDGLRALVEAAE